MYRSSPFRSTLNTGYITGLGMCKVCTEAVHSVALWTRVTLQVWTCAHYVPNHWKRRKVHENIRPDINAPPTTTTTTTTPKLGYVCFVVWCFTFCNGKSSWSHHLLGWIVLELFPSIKQANLGMFGFLCFIPIYTCLGAVNFRGRRWSKGTWRWYQHLSWRWNKPGWPGCLLQGGPPKPVPTDPGMS